MEEGPKKTPPSVGPSHYTTFEDYWLEQDELWELSFKESVRQKKRKEEKERCRDQEYARRVIKNLR
jgi:hypothetical protein